MEDINNWIWKGRKGMGENGKERKEKGKKAKKGGEYKWLGVQGRERDGRE